jgi:SHS2 domain-containing protein
VRSEAGFYEREHTADWELEAWAPDFPALLEQAARGMNALSGIRLMRERRVIRRFEVIGSDQESLLVKFLSELLYLGEQEGLGFDGFGLSLDKDRLSVEAHGSPILHQEKQIKAVTYHNLAVRQGMRGLEVNVVFDV